MSRWVDVDRLLLELSDLIDEFSELDERGLHSERWCGIMDSKGIIVKAPTISLVRCAECRHKRLYDGETKYYYCALEDRPNRQWSVDDWNFCCWGERKENE